MGDKMFRPVAVGVTLEQGHHFVLQLLGNFPSELKRYSLERTVLFVKPALAVL